MPLLPAGSAAPHFTLPDVNGEARSLWLQGSQTTLLVFFKVSCPTCQLMLPFVERLHAGANGNLRVQTVSQDNPVSTQRFRRSYDLTVPTLIDDREGGYPASNAYGLTHVPSLFLIEPDGRVSWSDHGFSRLDVTRLGERFGVDLILPGEYVPEWKGG